MKKFRIISGWLAIMAYLLFVPGFMWESYREVICEEVDVRISGDPGGSFVNQDEIMEIVRNGNGKLLGYPLFSINTREIEEKVNLQPFVKNTNIFRAAGGRLIVGVEQRVPVLRIIDKNREDYYIDREGIVLPVSYSYTSHILVASGNIPRIPDIRTGLSVIEREDDSNNGNHNVLNDLFILASYIGNDSFWRSQIVQLYVVDENEFELIPRVGAHIIKFGGISDYELKFRKLRALYEYGLPHKGWNNYEVINIKYSNQVICTRR